MNRITIDEIESGFGNIVFHTAAADKDLRGYLDYTYLGSSALSEARIDVLAIEGNLQNHISEAYGVDEEVARNVIDCAEEGYRVGDYR